MAGLTTKGAAKFKKQLGATRNRGRASNTGIPAARSFGGAGNYLSAGSRIGGGRGVGQARSAALRAALAPKKPLKMTARPTRPLGAAATALKSALGKRRISIGGGRPTARGRRY